ncbi:MAG: efflux RND transporter permease subunit, partial [Candidatus Kapaibacterium sp.]
MTLTEISIKRPTLVVVIFAALGVLGLFSFAQLKYELLPKISPPIVTIATVYPGASPSEVEASVTKVIEDAVSGLDKIQDVRSSSREGVSFVTIQYLQSANIDFALQDAQRKVGEVLGRLPEGAKSPTLSKFALDEIPVLRMGVTSTMPEKEFYQFLKDRIKPQISKVPGVGNVTLVGGNEREIQVNLHEDALMGYGLSMSAVTQTIKASNLDFPTGNIKDADGQFVVRIAGKIASITDLRNLIVGKSRSGGDVKLSDVADVQDGQKEDRTLSRINNVSSIGILVQKQSDANSVDVSKLVRAELAKLELSNKSANVKFDVAQDGSLFTVDAADAVTHDLFIAVILVACVMLLFLHSFRNSVIVMVAIPASLISTFIAMYAFNLTLNLMTLLALSLVVGILVDDSIVVLENIYRRLELGDDQRTAALRGRNEIGFAALSITLVDVVVFLPLTLVQGLVGNILRDFALVVVVSTLLSLFVSFTVTPMLASRFSKLQHLTRETLMGRFGLWFEGQYDKLTAFYVGILGWCLRHRWVVFASTLVLLIGSFALVGFGFVGGEFITQSDRGEFAVSIELPPGATLAQTNRITQQVERTVLEMPEVNKAFVNVGASSEGLVGQTSNNSAELNIALVPKEQRVKSTDEVADAIKQKVGDIPGVKVRVNPIGIFGTANQTPIQIGVVGANLDSVRYAANIVADLVRKIPGSADVRLSSEDGKPETRVQIDRDKMASFGLSLAEVGATLRLALSGDDDAKFRDASNEYDIRIMLDEADRSHTADVSNLSFITRTGAQVQLKQFASIIQTTGPTILQRKDRNSTVNVMSQVIGRPTGTVGGEIQKAIAARKLPAGVEIAYDGDLKNQGDAFGSLGAAL